MKWLWRGLAGLGAVVFVVAAGAAIATWDPLPDNPDPQELASGASAYDAEIIRDSWGVPHIVGPRDADVAFGLAYAHAEDDFETIQLSVAAGRGALARYQGASAAPTDYLVHLFGVWRTLERYETDVPEESRAIAEAYAAGLNLYASENPDATWRGLAPFHGEDVVAGFVLKTPFFYGLDSELLALFGDERPREVALDPAGGAEAFIIGPKRMAERGSNAFAVAPSRSDDGHTRLIINSHQPFEGPVAWYEAHLISQEGLDISGGLFPGSPLILHGFNRHLGWANTVNKPDLADVYVLERHPRYDDLYAMDGAWHEFEVEEAEIKVRLFGPFTYTAKRKLLRSKHGPVIEADHGTYAIRYAGMDEIGQLEQYRRLNRATNFEDWLNALRLQALPSINYIYADKTGNIAFVHNGQYPIRPAGWDWTKYLPGDRAELIWDGYRPFEEVPLIINPASGFLYNANNTPFSATDGPDNLRPEDFPVEMGLQTNETNRALRIQELTDGVRSISDSGLLAIKFDKRYSRRSIAAETVRKILSTDWTRDRRLAAAADHLASWDLSTEASNTHAALGVLSTIEATTEEITGLAPPEPEEAFRRAERLLRRNFGRIDPDWGEVNQLVRGELRLPLGGGPDVLRAVYPAEIRGDGRLYAAAGDTYVALVEWDEAGELSARAVHQFGSATLDEASPHFADQAVYFAAERFRPVLMELDEIEADAKARYRPGER
ncbi:MAG: acylase [Pseudomonadota bacterium]